MKGIDVPSRPSTLVLIFGKKSRSVPALLSSNRMSRPSEGSTSQLRVQLTTVGSDCLAAMSA
jgi:hypothetical protein